MLHDWDDHDAAAILASCRHAARPGAWLIIIERALPEQPGPGDLEALLTDLTMLVMLGGRERTQTGYHDLLTAAGFGPGPVIGTGTEFSLITATTTDTPAPAPSLGPHFGEKGHTAS